jgi:hypothetical protein
MRHGYEIDLGGDTLETTVKLHVKRAQGDKGFETLQRGATTCRVSKILANSQRSWPLSGQLAKVVRLRRGVGVSGAPGRGLLACFLCGRGFWCTADVGRPQRRKSCGTASPPTSQVTPPPALMRAFSSNTCSNPAGTIIARRSASGTRGRGTSHCADRGRRSSNAGVRCTSTSRPRPLRASAPRPIRRRGNGAGSTSVGGSRSPGPRLWRIKTRRSAAAFARRYGC